MHHFGTKDGLIEHCDAYVLGHVERLRGDFLRGETTIDSVTGYLADRPELLPMTRYLSQALVAGGEGSRRVFDRMIDVARSNLETGIEVGRIRPVDDLEVRAAVLASWNAAVIMLGDAIAARLGARRHPRSRDRRSAPVHGHGHLHPRAADRRGETP